MKLTKHFLPCPRLYRRKSAFLISYIASPSDQSFYHRLGNFVMRQFTVFVSLHFLAKCLKLGSPILPHFIAHLESGTNCLAAF